MPSTKQSREILSKYGISPKKELGQNFLVQRHIAEAIVKASGVNKEDTVIEVGVGLGALTIPLAETVHRVIGLEVDSGLVRLHQKENDLPENVTLLHQDILKADLAALSQICGQKLKIIANLPYSITHPFLFKILEQRHWIDQVTVMIQKEVADRILAHPACKEYGISSILLQYSARISRVLTVQSAEFFPRPKVDSAVLNLSFHHNTLLSDDEFDLLQKIVRCSFGQRRKTLLNSLSNVSLWQHENYSDQQKRKEVTAEVLQQAGIVPTVRPEALPIETFIRLAQTWYRTVGDSLGRSTAEA